MKTARPPILMMFFEWSGLTEPNLKPKTERIFLTEAALPDMHRVRIEQDYFLLIKWQHRTEGMAIWI